MGANGTFIEKAVETVETSAFLNGGRLNPEQQDAFMVLVRQFSKLIPMARVERVDNPKLDIDKLHIGEPVTRKAPENQDAGSPQKPAKFNKVSIDCLKLRSDWQVTTESLEENIGRAGLEDQLMAAMMQQISTDLENLAINGDSAIAGATPLDELLKSNDGWDKLSDDAHIVDVNGGFLSKRVFAAMLRTLPKQFRNDPNLRWLCSRGAMVDWMEQNSDRQTALGDAALQGGGIKPFGIAMEEIPLMPDDKLVNVKVATSATVLATRFGPFEIKAGVNDKLKLDVNNAGPVTVTLAAGVFEAFEIAGQINAAGVSLAGVASDDGEGRLLLKSSTTGVASEVDVQAQATSAYATLGLTVAVVNGVAAGTGQDVPEGTFIWLANPKNFIWAVLNGTRIHSEFEMNFDRMETVVFNRTDAQIENKNALVKAVNIRTRVI